MEQNITNEFSFILKPSQHGVGVFATHDIKKGTFLRLFGDENPNEPDNTFLNCRFLKKEDIPEPFKDFCVFREKGILICPKDFGRMPVGHYLNHSKTPNAEHKNYYFFASRDIPTGEEITIDYNTLEEPEESKEFYYK